MKARIHPSLAIAVAFASASASASAAQSNLDARLRQIMEECGRAGYVLKPIGHKRLVIGAVPTIRQTPLSQADLKCIRRGVAKLPGWRLVAEGQK